MYENQSNNRIKIPTEQLSVLNKQSEELSDLLNAYLDQMEKIRFDMYNGFKI
jgi:hypothetical protein